MQNRHIIYIMLFVHKGQLIISSLQRRYVSYVNCFGKHFAFCVKRISFKFPRLGGTNPNSGILYILNAKACCSGCVFCCPSFFQCLLQACVVQWLLLAVVCACVCVLCLCVYIYRCIHKLYTYIYIYNFSQQISVQPCDPKGGSAQMPSMKLTA